MKNIQSQRGNSLLIAMLVLMIGTIIGLTLISLTMNGTTRNEHRENYNQAKSYAENGIEHIIAHIEKEVLGKDIPKSEITSPTNVPPDNFQNYLNKFNRFLNDHKCQGGNPFVYKEKDGTLRYEVCFSNVGNKDDFRKTIKIQSTGHANGEERTIEADVEIGAEYKNYPSFLDFAVSTHPGVPPEEGKPDYRKETLILNGGLQIKGDVYTNGNIIVSNYAYVPIVDSEGWVNPWKKSTYPEIIGTNGKPATIYYNPEKSLFKMKSNQEFSNKPEKCKRSNETKGLIEFLSSSIGTVVNGLIDVVSGITVGNFKIPSNIFNYYDLQYYNFDLKESNSECFYTKGTIEEVLNNNDSNGPLIEKSKVTLSPTYGELKPVQIAGTNSYISIGKSKINQKANEKLEVVWWRPLTSLNEVYKKMENGGNYKVEDLSIIIRDRTLKGNLYITTDEPYLSSVYLSNSAELTELLNNILPSLGLGDLLKTIELDELLKLLIGAKKHANGMNGQFYIENGGEQDKLLIDLLKNLKLISSTDDPNDKLLLDFLLHNGGLIPEGKAINLDPGLFANEKFNLNGVYFIEGDVKINDSIINGNAILFVNGNVDIQRSQLNTSEDKKLIIFATGDIIYRFSSNTDGQITKNYVDTNTDVVNAFLYSDRKVELHGTVSDIHIKGGISANKVILTGIRGKLKSNLIIPDMFKNPTDTNANSRLIIEHDPKVIDVVKAHLGLKEYDDIKGTFDALPYYHEVFIKPANIKSRKTK